MLLEVHDEEEVGEDGWLKLLAQGSNGALLTRVLRFFFKNFFW